MESSEERGGERVKLHCMSCELDQGPVKEVKDVLLEPERRRDEGMLWRCLTCGIGVFVEYHPEIPKRLIERW